VRNQLGALPAPSAAVVAAFPDRFRRDALGTLVVVDTRSVNFARQRSEQLRFGVGFTIPFGAADPASTIRGSSGRRPLPVRLQVNASETVVLHSTVLIRQGLGKVDLLTGGALGVGGAQQKFSTDFNIALTRGQSGVRLSMKRRGASYLLTGTAAAPDLLTFHPLATLDLKAFVELAEFLPKSKWARQTRATVVFDNLMNERQRVTDRTGATPAAFQPLRRDSLGRTVRIELRKAF
jgi:hypothetical protein